MVGAAAARCRQRARLSNLRCGFGSLFGCLLMRVPQLRVKARRAQSAGLTAVALREVIAAGWTVELRVGHRMAVRDGGHFGPTPGTLLTDDSVALHAESGHLPPHRTVRITE